MSAAQELQRRAVARLHGRAYPAGASMIEHYQQVVAACLSTAQYDRLMGTDHGPSMGRPAPDLCGLEVVIAQVMACVDTASLAVTGLWPSDAAKMEGRYWDFQNDPPVGLADHPGWIKPPSSVEEAEVRDTFEAMLP